MTQPQQEVQAPVIWFTGLSGAGKSTLATHLYQELRKQDIECFLLDGDKLRSGLNKDLDFSLEARHENIRRAAEIAKLIANSGQYVLASFITPLESDRALAREIIGKENYIEVFVNCNLNECEKRDTKGLYKRARSGELKDFTGIDSPFDVPLTSDIEVDTANTTIEDCVKAIRTSLQQRGLIN